MSMCRHLASRATGSRATMISSPPCLRRPSVSVVCIMSVCVQDVLTSAVCAAGQYASVVGVLSIDRLRYSTVDDLDSAQRCSADDIVSHQNDACAAC